MKKYLFVLFGISISSISFSQFTDIEIPHRLGGEVNTVRRNFPIFSKETSTLSFRSFDSSSIGGYTDQDIWQSEKSKIKTIVKVVSCMPKQ